MRHCALIRMLCCPVRGAPERFQSIARQPRQVLERVGAVQQRESARGLVREPLERGDPVALEESSRVSVLEASNHQLALTIYVNPHVCLADPVGLPAKEDLGGERPGAAGVTEAHLSVPKSASGGPRRSPASGAPSTGPWRSTPCRARLGTRDRGHPATPAPRRESGLCGGRAGRRHRDVRRGLPPVDQTPGKARHQPVHPLRRLEQHRAAIGTRVLAVERRDEARLSDHLPILCEFD